MAILYQTFLKKLMANTGPKFRSSIKRVRVWFRQQAKQLQSASALEALDADTGQLKKRKYMAKSNIGDMAMFLYDPKWKKILPYYDTVPVIFMIEQYPDGFLGINLHYLPHKERAMLMDALYNDKLINKVTEKQKFILSYQILKNATKLKYFKPCVKRYLYKHVRSKIKVIEPQSWDMVLFLPLERFKKATREQVWKDSLKKAG